MKVLHLINKPAESGPGLRNLTKLQYPPHTWESGYWDIPSEDARDLIDGMLYLHETKSKPSRFGGRVVAAREEETGYKRQTRVVFTIEALAEARGVKWRGKDHAMASYGGFLDLDG